MLRKTNPDGLWLANDEMESSALDVLEFSLSAFREIIADAYEAGVQAPTLQARRHHEPDMQAAALFLKRTLVDLRCLWLLLIRGYTSPAATVAASLWEHALTVSVLAGSPERTQELRRTAEGDVPWSPKELAAMAGSIGEASASKEERRTRSTNIYAAYKWLCKIKHPTLRSTLHDSGASQADDGHFVVMSAPDLRDEDLPVKSIILLLSCGRVIEAIKAFASALQCQEGTDSYQSFTQRVHKAQDSLFEFANNTQEPLPFGLTARERAKL